MTSRAAIGIDLGGTNLRVAAVDFDGRVLARRQVRTDLTLGPKPVIAQMADLTMAVMEGAGLSLQAVVAAGVGAPGPLSQRRGRIIRCANLPSWIDVPLRALLAERLAVPVWLENDANAAAFGEFWVGAGKDGSDMVMLTLGTGLGAGVILSGKLVYGHFENAAELGHTIVQPDGLPCPCGQSGCLEQYVSAGAVARRAVAAMQAGAASGLSTHLDTGGCVTAAMVGECVRRGDPMCTQVWKETCQYLALAVINIQHAFNPRRVILGGGLAQAGSLLLDGVVAEFASRRWKLHDDFPEVSLAELGDDAGVIGAARLATMAPSHEP